MRVPTASRLDPRAAVPSIAAAAVLLVMLAVWLRAGVTLGVVEMLAFALTAGVGARSLFAVYPAAPHCLLRPVCSAPVTGS